MRVLQVFKVGQYFRVHAARCSPCWPSPAPPEPAPPASGRILLLLLLLHILAFFKDYICQISTLSCRDKHDN